MILRPFSVVPLSLSLCFLAWPLQARAQAPVSLNSSVNPATITVQIEPPPISISSAVLGLAEPIGAQAISGKPLFAEFVTVHHQSFTDGNRISHTTTSTIHRDAEGRIRRESQLSIAGIPSGVSTSSFITIVDHCLGYGYILDPQENVAHRYELNGAGPSYVARVSAKGKGNALAAPESPSAPAAPSTGGQSHWHLHSLRNQPPLDSLDAGLSTSSKDLFSSVLEGNSISSTPAVRIDQPFLAAPNPVRTENLGEQTILGFVAHGTRVITTLPAGQIGNDRPIDIISEQWFAPEVALVMRSMHRDPWAGEFTTTVAKVTRRDQPAALFEIPENYKIIDAATEGDRHVLEGPGSHPSGSTPR
ncbi:MAG: hypothetical protein CXZ00_00765 [Acidobacteria bacterium]|nr:MAG: hypothetical protein CXZ00_00765 [Acidobacteriota bacterium]